jgi:hypothetical protein
MHLFLTVVFVLQANMPTTPEAVLVFQKANYYLLQEKHLMLVANLD